MTKTCAGLKIGFLGGGQMAEAILRALLSRDVLPKKHIFLSDHKQKRASALEDQYGIHAFVGTESFIKDVDVLILAVKPQSLNSALEEIQKANRKNLLILSIVAGASLRNLEERVPSRVIRVMPNTPLSVGEGMSALALGSRATDDDSAIAQQIFGAAGEIVTVPESMMDAVTGLSGSGPAFAFLMIDALSDGGVAAGLRRKDATKLAAQTLLGSAKMVLETSLHPDALRDAVTSPAGTTIEGVRVLEERGVRGALIDAVLRAAERSRDLGKK